MRVGFGEYYLVEDKEDEFGLDIDSVTTKARAIFLNQINKELPEFWLDLYELLEVYESDIDIKTAEEFINWKKKYNVKEDWLSNIAEKVLYYWDKSGNEYLYVTLHKGGELEVEWDKSGNENLYATLHKVEAGFEGSNNKDEIGVDFYSPAIVKGNIEIPVDSLSMSIEWNPLVETKADFKSRAEKQLEEFKERIDKKFDDSERFKKIKKKNKLKLHSKFAVIYKLKGLTYKDTGAEFADYRSQPGDYRRQTVTEAVKDIAELINIKLN